MNTKQSLIGGLLAFVIGSACCWLPAVIVVLGGASSLMSFSEALERFSGVFMGIGALLLGYGLFRLVRRKAMTYNKKTLVLKSKLTCPHCGYEREETMPEDACTFFYQCESCKAQLRPLEGDCCVYCSYGSVPCPPVQKDESCC